MTSDLTVPRKFDPTKQVPDKEMWQSLGLVSGHSGWEEFLNFLDYLIHCCHMDMESTDDALQIAKLQGAIVAYRNLKGLHPKVKRELARV